MGEGGGGGPSGEGNHFKDSRGDSVIACGCMGVEIFKSFGEFSLCYGVHEGVEEWIGCV